MAANDPEDTAVMSRAALSFVLIAALVTVGGRYADASELLANGGFEQGPAGWSIIGGDLSELDAVSAPVHEGALAGRFVGTGQPTTQFVYQWTDVQPGQNYELTGWAAMSGGGLGRLFLRVDWFDASSQEVPFKKDSNWLPLSDGTFYFLSTGPSQSPLAARHARTSVVVQADSPFTVLLDDFVFSGPAAILPPLATPTPAPSGPPTPAPATVTPTSTPKPPSPTRTPAPQQTPGSTAEATPLPAVEPVVFPHLVNAGFEELRGDGTPFGWRKQGGDMMTVVEPRTEGSRALMLRSETSSTKWAYQTIAVQGGAYYDASVQAFAGPGSESVLLRVSWYASADGSGQAIDSTDSSKDTHPDDGGFRRLAAGPVQAPSGAQTAKVRLMLRPLSEARAEAYFDDARFGQTQASGERIAGGADAALIAAGRYSVGPSAEAGAEPVVAVPTPPSLANVKPIRADLPGAQAPVSGARDDWAILLAICVAVAAFGLAGGYELWHRRSVRGGGADNGA